MVWTARWGHVSQLYRHAGDGPGVVEGASDCFEASLARYLRETGVPAGAAASGQDPDLIGYLRERVTGQPDHAGQGYTSLGQGTAGLRGLGIAASWTFTLQDAMRASWAILWVRANRLRLQEAVTVDGVPRWTAYPLSWLPDDAGAPDHFILKLPDGRVNDPLAYYCGDCRYSPTSLASAFGGAWILLTPAASSGPAGDLVVAAQGGLHLREAPTMAAAVLATLDDGERIAEAYEKDCLWRFVAARGQHGWVRREYVKSRALE